MDVRTVELPTFVLSLGNERCSMRMMGEYRILNLSEVPMNLRTPHPLGYNLANRGLQFKVMRNRQVNLREPANTPDEIFRRLIIDPNHELTLLSSSNSSVEVERYCVSKVPKYLWLEIL